MESGEKMQKTGLIHLYCGDGKGKTTAAMGLILRAIGYGYQTAVVQFLKDGNSSELKALKAFSNVRILSGKDVKGFTFSMTEEEKERVRCCLERHFTQAVAWCRENLVDVLLLDEIIDAVNMGFIEQQELMDFLQTKPTGLEVIMTGRNPKSCFVDISDYYSNVQKIKHPYDRGIAARAGIEW